VYDSCDAGRLPPWPPGASSSQTYPVADDSPICSARGCRVPARWALEWNNPKLHDPERRKTWLACAEHRASLEEFLEIRGFLRATRPLP